MSALWYEPRQIIFSHEQVLWLLDHIQILRDGKWPPRPASGYVEPNIQKSPSRHAPFETPVQVAAELLARLGKAGQDGAMVKLMYCYGEDDETIARHWHITVDTAKRRINRAINYCCGWRRKGDYRQKW